MRKKLQAAAVLALGIILGTSARADTIYNNLTPNNLMAMASSPGSGVSDIEAADDFLLTSGASITSASFTGLFVGGTAPSISQLVIEIYRVFPLDSNIVRTPNVLTRVNSPSDVEFADRDSAAGALSFSSSTLAASFTALNSVHLGINQKPNQTTGGEGPVTGQEVQIDVSFLLPLNLPADHYFFVPQVLLTNGGQFYWLSASRPISGGGTTNFAPDLQAWIRNENLAPDWSRVGTDIVGDGSTFNASFSLNGTPVPEPASITLVIGGLALIGFRRTRGVTLSKGVDAVLCRRSNTPRL